MRNESPRPHPISAQISATANADGTIHVEQHADTDDSDNTHHENSKMFRRENSESSTDTRVVVLPSSVARGTASSFLDVESGGGRTNTPCDSIYQSEGVCVAGCWLATQYSGCQTCARGQWRPGNITSNDIGTQCYDSCTQYVSYDHSQCLPECPMGEKAESAPSPAAGQCTPCTKYTAEGVPGHCAQDCPSLLYKPAPGSGTRCLRFCPAGEYIETAHVMDRGGECARCQSGTFTNERGTAFQFLKNLYMLRKLAGGGVRNSSPLL